MLASNFNKVLLYWASTSEVYRYIIKLYQLFRINLCLRIPQKHFLWPCAPFLLHSYCNFLRVQNYIFFLFLPTVEETERVSVEEYLAAGVKFRRHLFGRQLPMEEAAIKAQARTPKNNRLGKGSGLPTYVLKKYQKCQENAKRWQLNCQLGKLGWDFRLFCLSYVSKKWKITFSTSNIEKFSHYFCIYCLNFHRL